MAAALGAGIGTVDDDGEVTGEANAVTVVGVAPLLMIFTNFDGVVGTAVAKMVGVVVDDADVAVVLTVVAATELDATLAGN